MQEKLPNLALLFIKYNVCEKLDYNDIINFAEFKARNIKHMEKFLKIQVQNFLS